MYTPKKILIVGPSWVGDMVMGQSLFGLLKERFPESAIDVLANAPLLPLLARMPHVDRAFKLPFAHGELNIKSRFQLGSSLRDEYYDQAIVLPNSFKSALVPFWARIPKRTGWRGEMRYGLLNDLRELEKSKLPLMVERFMALGLDQGESLPQDWSHPKLKTTKHFVEQTLSELNINLTKQPILALCPGAEYGPAKRWPTEHFARVAKTKIQEGWQVILLGGNADRLIADTIQKITAEKCLDLTGKTDLAQAIDVLSLANYVVTNDSGLMHIAAALQRPLIAIYGSSSPHFTPPLSNTAKILSLELPCSPCFKRKCPLDHLHCLRELNPERVLDLLSF